MNGGFYRLLLRSFVPGSSTEFMPGGHWAVTFVMVNQFYFCFFLMPINTFFFAFIQHHAVSYSAYRLLGHVIDTNHLKPGHAGEQDVPRLDFLNPVNVRTWLHSVMIMVHYQKRLKSRLNAFVGTFFCLLAAIFVVVILPSATIVFGGGDVQKGYVMDYGTFVGLFYFYIFFPIALTGVAYGSVTNS